MDGVFRLERRVFDPDLRPQLCNLLFRLQLLLCHRPLPLQQLLCHRPLPLHPLQRKRLRLRIRPQQLHLQLRPRPFLNHIAPTTPPLPLSLPRRLLLLLQLLRAVSARLLLHDGPHALVGHGGGEVASGGCCCF